MTSERLTLADDAQGICDEVMTRYLLPETRYDHARVAGLVTSISDQVLQRLTQQTSLPRKYAVHVAIVQNNGAGLCAVSSCEWRATSDACYVHRANNKAMWCIVTIYGVTLACCAMLRRSVSRRMRICYVTDIEGDVRYLERFLHTSVALRRCPASPHASTTPPYDSSSSSVAAAAASATAALPFALDFVDDATHFVYGGDVFDHGSDLTFARLLLDFWRRHPRRVHLLLGNRDLNKMVMRTLLRDVDGGDAAAVQRRAFPRSWSGGRDAVPYAHYLRAARRTKSSSSDDDNNSDNSNNSTSTLRADRVSFLQWALEYKLGSKDSFAHRRRELQAWLSQQAQTQQQTQATQDACALHDRDVADSFFAAAQDGGVYDAYLRAGKLMVVLDGVLFVHGGVTDDNLCFVPDAEATYNDDDDVDDNATSSDGATDGDVGTTSSSSSLLRQRLLQRGVRLPPQHTSLQAWASALDAFRARCVDAWAAQRGGCGEALRRYACPRECTWQSVVVASPIARDGPHYAPLSVIEYLLASGVHTVCAGHQPAGDTPVLIAQPGGFLTIVADNSYCAAAYNNNSDNNNKSDSDSDNMRGRAVTEIVFEDNSHSSNSSGWSVRVHGRRADGRAYAFDARSALLGRHVGDGWWVKCLTRTRNNNNNNNSSSSNNSSSNSKDDDAPSSSSSMTTMYELQRTRDAFRSVDVRVVDRDTLQAMLRAHREPPVGGEAVSRYTHEQLADVRVHRLKTKVSPPPPSAAAAATSTEQTNATDTTAAAAAVTSSPHRHHL